MMTLENDKNDLIEVEDLSFNVNQVVELTGISASTIHRYIKNGRLQATNNRPFTLRGSYMIAATELERFTGRSLLKTADGYKLSDPTQQG